ncbi:putative DNA adenine methyltransferase [Klebsiella phage ValerieMcCarty02]|nr:putative DNA adenine methyltransferase [Klebsiella phage ValerieMcCarty02]
MSKFSVTGYSRVNIRCQFDEIPGVTHIELVFDPHSLYNQVSGKIDSAYGEFLINDQVIISALSGNQAGSLYILKKEVFEEISEAIKEGFKTLQNMIKASGYKSCGF